MASKKNTIILEVLLDEKDLVKKVSAIFSGSTKVAEALSKAFLPIEKGIDNAAKKQEIFNKALAKALVINGNIAKSYDQIHARQSKVIEQMRAIAAMGSGRGPTAVAAREELTARGDGATARPSGNALRDANAQVQARSRLLGALQNEKEEEEDLTAELAKQVRAHIAIAKAQRDRSPESVAALVSLERELGALTDDTAEGLEKQGRYAELLLKSEKQLTDEAQRGAKAARQYNADYLREVRSTPEGSNKAGALRGRLEAERRNLPNLEDGTPERAAALTNIIELEREYQKVQAQTAAKIKKDQAERINSVRKQVDLELAAAKARVGSDGDSRQKLVDIEQRLVANARNVSDEYEVQTAYLNNLAKLKREIEAIDKRGARVDAEVERGKNRNVSNLIGRIGDGGMARDKAIPRLLALEDAYNAKLEQGVATAEEEYQIRSRLVKIQKALLADAAKGGEVLGDAARKLSLIKNLGDTIKANSGEDDAIAKQSLEYLEGQLVKLQEETKQLMFDTKEYNEAIAQINAIKPIVNSKNAGNVRGDAAREERRRAANAEIDNFILDANPDTSEGRRAMEVLIQLAKEYKQALAEGNFTLDKQVEIKRRLAKIEVANQRFEKRDPRTDLARYGRDEVRLTNIQRIIKDSRKSGDVDAIEQSIEALEKYVQTTRQELSTLTEDTKEYTAALKNLAKANDILTSRETTAPVADRRERELAAQIERDIRLRNQPGEVGQSARDRINAARTSTGAERDSEIAKVQDLRRELAGLEDAEQARLATQRELQAAMAASNDTDEIDRLRAAMATLSTEGEEYLRIVRQIEEAEERAAKAGELNAKLNSDRGQGTGRDALKRRRREQGYDSYSALIDIGRVAQDAPYGLEGVANNIAPLVESVSNYYDRVKQATDGTKSFRTAVAALGKDLFTTPIGWIALFNIAVLIYKIIPKITAKFKEMTENLDLAAKKAKELEARITAAAGKKLGEIITSENVADNRKNADAIIAELQRVTAERDRIASAGASKTIDQSTTGGRLAVGYAVSIQSAVSSINKFLGITNSMDEAILAQEARMAALEESYKAVSESVVDADATTRAFQNAIASGTTAQFTRNIIAQQEVIRKATLQTALEGARTVREKVRITTALFAMETAEQKRQLEIQIRNERARLLAYADVAYKTRQRYVNGVDGTTLAQANEAIGTFNAQIGLVNALGAALRDLAGSRAGALANQIEDLEKTKDTTENLLDALRQAQQKIQDMILDIRDLRNKNDNYLESRQFEMRRQEQALATSRAAVEAAQAREDFIDQTKKLAQRGTLLAQFDSAQAQMRIERARATAIELAKINKEDTLNSIQEAREQLAAQNALNDINLEGVFGDEAEMQRLTNSFTDRMDEINYKIQEINATPTDELTNSQAALLEIYNQQLAALELIQPILEQRQKDAVERRLDSVADNTQADKNNNGRAIQEAAAERIKNTMRREARLLAIRYEAEEDAITLQEAEEQRAIDAIDNAEEREIRQAAFEQKYLDLRQAAQMRYANAVRDIQYKLLNDQQDAIKEVAMNIIGSLDQLAKAGYENWENDLRNRLAKSGASEEEITAEIEKQGSKRKKIVNAIAKAQIVASTAVAAMDAFEGVMKYAKFLGPAAIPLALTAAGIAIAFGKTQYDAVGKDNIGSSKSSSGGFTVGTESAPGVQSSDPFTTADPFGQTTRTNETVVLDGMTKMGDRIEALGAQVMESAQVIASRPAYVGYTPESASQFVAVGNERTDFVTRG